MIDPIDTVLDPTQAPDAHLTAQGTVEAAAGVGSEIHATRLEPLAQRGAGERPVGVEDDRGQDVAEVEAAQFHRPRLAGGCDSDRSGPTAG